MTLAIYYEGGTVDRFWLAPTDPKHPSNLLGLGEARKQRVGRFYKTREGARRGLVAALDREQLESARRDPRGLGDGCGTN